jgi:2-iminobutanoate/2-iminopropanoate deaminase
MNTTPIHTPNAPAPIGPYSQAVAANGMLFISGQIAIDPATGEMLGNDLALQTEQVMRNLQAILEAAGTSFARVVKTGIFLAPGMDFGTVNGIYNRFFESNYPARETVWVNELPKKALVEISMIALL